MPFHGGGGGGGEEEEGRGRIIWSSQNFPVGLFCKSKRLVFLLNRLSFRILVNASVLRPVAKH